MASSPIPEILEEIRAGSFVVVVDDSEMGITHVLRGDDHINNTPRQLHIYNALGAPIPRWSRWGGVIVTTAIRKNERQRAHDRT